MERLFTGEDNPTFVIRCLLNTNEEEEQEWTHPKNFHRRVIVIDKAVNVVIDNGSAINFVAQEVIDKLNLTTEKLRLLRNFLSPTKSHGLPVMSFP